LIELRDVSFSFPSARGIGAPVLSDLSLEIRPGECFCLLGPSGCGKSTALSLVAGFNEPDTGEVLVDGELVRAPAADRAVVFQGDDSLFDWLTAVENVAFGLRLKGIGRKERERVARTFLKLVGLRERDGGKYPSALSGGMRQRVQIARVLANEPRILLMDEPFAAVDAQTRSELQEELLRVWSTTNKTLLFITHDIGEAILLGDRIGVMRRGSSDGSAIREIVPVDIDRPRSHADPRFGQLYERIYRILKEEVALGRSESGGDN
jgi:NitT/TauT family transport system ATP-binding protein